MLRTLLSAVFRSAFASRRRSCARSIVCRCPCRVASTDAPMAYGAHTVQLARGLLAMAHW
jgi:hypothetical protein